MTEYGYAQVMTKGLSALVVSFWRRLVVSSVDIFPGFGLWLSMLLILAEPIQVRFWQADDSGMLQGDDRDDGRRRI